MLHHVRSINRSPLAAVATVVVALILVLLLTTVFTRVSASDGMTLHAGVATTADVMSMTAAAYPDVAFTPEQDSADPVLASGIRNHRSLSDHSDPQQFPGYNDCDAFLNLFDDGWSATSAMSASITPEQADALLADVRPHWQAQGYAVEQITFGSGSRALTRLSIDLGFASVALDVDPQRGTARLAGTTDCLAPG